MRFWNFLRTVAERLRRRGQSLSPLRRRFLGSLFLFSALTLWLTLALPPLLAPWLEGVLSREQLQLGMMLGRAVFLAALALRVVLYLGWFEARRDWDSSLPWHRALVIGFQQSPAIHSLYQASVNFVLLGVVRASGIGIALVVLLLWEILLLLCHLVDLVGDPAGALLGSPGGRATYVVLLSRHIPVHTLLLGAGSAAYFIGDRIYDGYQRSADRKLQLQLEQNRLEIRREELRLEQAKLERSRGWWPFH